MSAANKDEEYVMSRDDLTRVFEASGLNADNIVKANMLFEHAVLVKVADIEDGLTARFEVQQEELVRAIGVFLEQELEESIDDIRKLCLLAVSEIGGPEAVDAFIKKVAELARAGALSASSSEWAQGSPDDSASNKDSIRGGGVSTRKEDVEAEGTLTEHYVDAISRTVRRR
jgi:hypothetical protein